MEVETYANGHRCGLAAATSERKRPIVATWSSDAMRTLKVHPEFAILTNSKGKHLRPTLFPPRSYLFTSGTWDIGKDATDDEILDFLLENSWECRIDTE